MQKTELDSLLQELYSWNPKLKAQESQLIKLIEMMISVRPDTKFDESFAESLKKDLLSHQILLNEKEETKINYLLFNFKSMNKKIYIAVGTLVALSLVALIIVPSLFFKGKQIDNLFNNNVANNAFTKVAPGAFGSLLATSAGVKTASSQELTATLVGGNGSVGKIAADNVVAPATSVSSVGYASPISTVGMGGGGTVSTMPARIDSKMIAPMFSYKYVYKGEPLTLADETGSVYRRVKGDGNLSGNLDSLISAQTFGPINLSLFSGLQTSNISLSENKKLGLTINIDFREENIYIGENWLYWQSERDQCGDKQACWDSYRLKVNDIPEDTNLIATTNKFLSERGINLEHYGSPVVDNNWRTDYLLSQDKTNYYIPEYANVVYPLTVNNQSVYDQSGNLDGLRVSVNLLQKAVSGVSNLTSYRYETSEYALETSSDKILGLAENGGYSYSNYYGNTQEKVTLELGTPVRALVRSYRYINNNNDELLVPALIFPVTNAPVGYYGSKFVAVPLAKEMVSELSKQKDNINNSTPIPMPYDISVPAVKSSTGSEGLDIMTR